MLLRDCRLALPRGAVRYRVKWCKAGGNIVGKFARALVLGVSAAVLASCVDNMPVLTPVNTLDPPLNLPGVAHAICTTDGNFMYEEARRQYELRAHMANRPIDAANEEAQTRAAARRQYVACLSSQGYRIVYDR